jgi:hypothetical protein
MHASFAHFLKPKGRSWHCEDGPRSILPWLRRREMHMAVNESDLDYLDKWLSSDESPPNSKMLSDLDEFLTAVAIGPEVILPR